jgi:crossover junction endodeoxyribonuclease RuvC
MFVLGVDPGLTTTGYGVIERTLDGPRLRAVGVIRTPSRDPVERRLCELYDDLSGVIADHGPVVVAIERVFTNRNLQTAISVGRASGVVLLAAARAGLAVHEYSPTQVKSAVAGWGSAEKRQVQRMVGQRLGLSELPTPADAADALAVALCHLQGHRLAERVGS